MAIKSFSIVITDAPIWTETDLVHQRFSQIGTIDKIDVLDATSRGYECKKFFIHFSAVNDTKRDQELCLKLIDNEKRQKEGELFTPCKFYYDNRDHYWKIFKAQTPADRAAERATKTSDFTVRIEM
jgi:hypothetical protein